MTETSKSLTWFWLGMGCLGSSIGFFVGLSHSPVIATLLPLLFGLIGGSSGFLIARVKTAESELDSINTLKYAGVSFVIFSITVIVSSTVALNIKINSKNNENHVKLSFEKVEPTVAIQLVAIRKKLAILDASKVEQQQILNIAMTERVINASTKTEIKKYLNYLAIKSQSTADVIGAVISKEAPHIKERDKEDLEALLSILKVIDPLFEQWVTNITDEEAIPVAAIKKILTTLAHNLGEIIGGGESVALTTISNLSNYPELLRSLLELDSARRTNPPKWETSHESMLPSTSFEVDKLTELLISQSEKTKKEEVFEFAYNPLPDTLLQF